MKTPDEKYPRHGSGRHWTVIAVLIVALVGTTSETRAQATSDSSTADSVVVASAPAPTPVDDDQAATDGEIQRSLQAAFDRIPTLNGVEVSVEAGVVTLDGQVLDPQSREEAAELARAFDDVLVVLNHIEQSTSLQERLEPTMARLRDFFLDALARGPLLFVALLIVGVAWMVGRAIRHVRLPASVTRRNPFLQNLTQRFLQGAILLGGVIIALQLLDAVALVGALAGGAGLAGLTLGFAFKDIVENYLAGILLSLRHPFSTNDHVVVDGHEGKVVRLTWRDTILMTLDGNHLRIPNGRIFGSTVLNYTRNPKRRFSFDFGIGPADDLAEARSIGIATLESMESVLDDPPPQALALELGDSSVQMRYLGWVDQRERSQGRVRSEALRLVKLALEDAGISLPSPEYRVIMASEEAEADESASGTGQPPRSTETREEQDTGTDDTVDRQISQDHAESGEENLLTAGA